MTRIRINTRNIEEVIHFITGLVGLLTGATLKIVFRTHDKRGCGIYKNEKVQSLNEAIEEFFKFCDMHGDHAYLSYADFYHVDAYEGIDEDGYPFEVADGDFINVGFDEMEKFVVWELAFPNYKLIGKYDRYEHREVLKRAIFVNMDGEKIMGVYHPRGFYTHKQITPMWVIAHNGQYYVVCYESDAPNYIGKRIRCNHAIGFFSDETRKPEDMFRYLVGHPEYEICTSLKSELVFGKAWVLVEGEVVDAFNHNMYSIVVQKNHRVCDSTGNLDRMYEKYFEEEVNDEKWDKGGRCYHEIWLRNHKVVGVYDRSCNAVLKAAKKMGIPIIKTPCAGYCMCD